MDNLDILLQNVLHKTIEQSLLQCPFFGKVG